MGPSYLRRRALEFSNYFILCFSNYLFTFIGFRSIIYTILMFMNNENQWKHWIFDPNPQITKLSVFFSVRRARCRLLLVEGAAVAVMRCQYSWGCHAWMRSYRVCCCHLFILLSVLAQRFCHHVIIMCQSESQATPISLAFFTPFNPGVLIVLSPSGYGSIPIDTFLVGWTSIYQLFWGSLGTRVLTHPQVTTRLGTPKVLSCPGGSSRVIPLSQRGTCWNQLPLARYINHFFLWVRKQKLENYSGLVTTY